jgi:NAD+ diphosphatase
MIPAPGFCGSPLNRLEQLRYDTEAIDALTANPAALLLDLADYMPALDPSGHLAWSPLTPRPAGELALLGLIDDIPRFAHIAPDATGAARPRELFDLFEQMAPGEAATYATARSLLDWHARHRFCANCGTLTHVFRAGWARHCANCGAEHYPRTDPVVIMLAEHGAGDEARVLIGRQPRFPAGRYSALAGFVEVGEPIEEAVARELLEEAGVVTTSVRYLASQPWPFPSQLMIACIARVEDDVVTLDLTELEDARWVDRAEVKAALAGDANALFLPPPPYAIANTLFQAWVEGN